MNYAFMGDFVPSIEEFKSLLTSCPFLGVIEVDGGGSIISCNKGAEGILRLRSWEIVGRKASSFIYKSDLERLIRDVSFERGVGVSEEDVLMFLSPSGDWASRNIYLNVPGKGIVLHEVTVSPPLIGGRRLVLFRSLEEFQARQRSVVSAVRFNSMLKSVLEYFTADADFEQVVYRAFGDMGMLLGIDRISFYRYDPSSTMFELEVEWTGKGIESLKDSKFVFSLSSVEEMFSGLFANKLVEYRRSSSEEGVFWDKRGVESALCAPVFINDYLGGCLLFEFLEEEREWSSEESAAVRLLALNIARYKERMSARSALLREKRIREKEADRYRAMMDAMDEGIVFADASDKIVDVNRYFLKMVSADRSGIVGKKIYDIYPDTMKERLKNALILMKDIRSEVIEIEDDLFSSDLQIRIQPFYQDGLYRGVLLNHINLTELKRMKRIAEEASHAKSRFLADLGHEIRTPLHTIIGTIELNRDRYMSKEVREALEVIGKSASGMLSLLDRMVATIELDEFDTNIKCEPFDLEEFLESFWKEMEGDLYKRGVNLVRILDDRVKGFYLSDVNKLKATLANMVCNAVRYTTNDQVIFEVSISEEGEILFIVSDRKGGDLSLSGKRISGVGCNISGKGLHLAQQMIGAMGGKLWIESEVGRGASFYLSLPLKRLSREEYERMISGDGPEIGREELDVSGKVILLVEDSDMNRELGRKLLEKRGYKVVSVSNGREAVEFLRQNRVDLVLMDVQMPEMDGVEATMVIRGELGLKDLPVIALTAHALSYDRSRCLAAGMNDFLTKPIKADEMFTCINKYLFGMKGAHMATLDKTSKDEVKSSSMEPLDLKGAMDRLGVDESMFSELLKSFDGYLNEQMEKLKNLADGGRKEEMKREAHSLKGAAASVGAVGVSDVSKMMENFLDEGRFDEATELLPVLQQSVEEVHEFLKKKGFA